ncbi:hypothetical protein LOTGIDRAFT_168800 [Lottia gigantea]|uniref:SMB domain-containing protein n=1 Tax=Lottia gigantea TaxID=225164 RepID=V3ZPG3_LOTGI|nr:hypothetical protein LOTGIDRAFT_168800 [Lottia gigantea]ESO84355.1 hypothetical protein LOTGIDRAFT_168800 [Lottia gigantea]
METPCFTNLLQFFLTFLIIKPSNSKIIKWSSDLSKFPHPPESFGNLRELASEFQGWDRLAELNGWKKVPDNFSVNGTALEADVEPLECVLHFEGNSCFNSCGMFRSFFCSCDEFCYIYHSCCNDYEQNCLNESKRSLDRYGKFIGVPIDCISLKVGYDVISGCPEAANVTLSQRCREAGAEPLSVIHTGLHFKNIFCMQCFDVNEPVEKWKIAVGMDRRGKRSAKSFDLSMLFRNQITQTHSWEFTSKYLTRQCVPGAISRCPKNTPIKEQKLCDYARHPFKLQYQGSTNLELYNNAFCADCNSRFLKNVSHCSFLGNEYFRTSNSHLFKILMSLESPDSIIVTTIEKTALFPWSKIKCNSIVDDVPTGCHIMDCKDSYEFVNGECVRKKIEYSECFLLNFLLTKEQAADPNFEKFINDILVVTEDFLKGMNLTIQNYTLDSAPLLMSGNVRIVLRYNLVWKWIPDINVFISYVDYLESRKEIFDLKGELGICTGSPDILMCSMANCFLLSHNKTIRLGGDIEISTAMARSSVSWHNFVMILFVVLVIE